MATDVGDATDVEGGRPSTGAIIWAQLRHANRGFWRVPIAAFFTIVFPLIFLLLLGALIGNETVGDSDVRIAQFLTPAIAAFAATTASFTALAIGLVTDRDTGILKRVRGTPVQPWAFMAARIGSTVWIALVSVALMVAAGVAFFGVQLIGRTAPAALLTLAVGIGSFAALGFAVAALSPSANATQAITNLIIIPLAFVSGVFTQGDLPDWLERIASFFPLKPFVDALRDTFNPFETGAQFSWDDLAVMAAWGVGGALVALRFFSWEPSTGGRGGRRGALDETAAAPAGPPTSTPAATVGRPGVVALVATHTGYALRAFVRNVASAFFVVVFPVVLLLLLPVVFGNPELGDRGGIQLTQFLAAVLAVYGAATAAYADFSQQLAYSRDNGVLKRIHGTPLPVWAFVTGRILTAICVALAALVVTVGVGMLVHGVELVPRALPGLLISVVVGIACFAALGLAVAALAPNADAVPTIANATLLPLAFFSDIFIIGTGLPRWMEVVGWIFPLKHFANAVADGMNPTIPGAGFFWDHLAVMAAWLVVGLLLAFRFWTWEPRTPRTGGRRRRRAATAPDPAG